MKKYIFIGPIVALVLWVFLSHFEIVSPILLPSPIKVIKSLFHLVASFKIIPDLINTTILWLAGLFIGIGIGIPVGLLMGYSNKIYSSLEFLFDFFRSIPSIVLYPLFLIFFGLGNYPKLAVITFTTAIYLIINAAYGVKYSKASTYAIAKILKASKIQTFTKFIIPSALPEIFVGLRISLSMGLIIAVGSEMILGTQHGLGRLVVNYSLVYNMSELYSVIIIIGCLGYLSNKLFLLLEHKVIHWKGR